VPTSWLWRGVWDENILKTGCVWQLYVCVINTIFVSPAMITLHGQIALPAYICVQIGVTDALNMFYPVIHHTNGLHTSACRTLVLACRGDEHEHGLMSHAYCCHSECHTSRSRDFLSGTEVALYIIHGTKIVHIIYGTKFLIWH
jgi:hypothetical protein